MPVVSALDSGSGAGVSVGAGVGIKVSTMVGGGWIEVGGGVKVGPGDGKPGVEMDTEAKFSSADGGMVF